MATSLTSTSGANEETMANASSTERAVRTSAPQSARIVAASRRVSPSLSTQRTFTPAIEVEIGAPQGTLARRGGASHAD